MTEDKLDRSKTFGTVYGHQSIGYEQGGRQFRHDGTVYMPTQTETEVIGPGVTDVSPPKTVDAAVKTTLGLKTPFKRANDPSPSA